MTQPVVGPVIDVSRDATALATYVAQRFLTGLAEAQAAGRVPHVVLTGGTIASAIYVEVARLDGDADVDWDHVILWWGDERFVAEDSPDRNVGQARRAFLDAIPIPDANVHPMPSSDDASSADDGAAVYGELISANGTDEFEIVLLGVGPDGHVASLFPGFPQLERDDAIALGVYESPKPPPQRITLTLPALNRAREVWFLAAGPEKATAVASALSGDASLPISDTSLPAARVRGRVATIWFLDGAAAPALESPRQTHPTGEPALP